MRSEREVLERILKNLDTLDLREEGDPETLDLLFDIDICCWALEITPRRNIEQRDFRFRIETRLSHE